MLPTCSQNTCPITFKKRDRPRTCASDRSQRQVRANGATSLGRLLGRPAPRAVVRLGRNRDSQLAAVSFGRRNMAYTTNVARFAASDWVGTTNQKPLVTSAALMRLGRVYTRRSFTRPLRLVSD
jgi:hypothetical protein